MPGRPGAGMSAGMRNVPLLVRKKKRNVDTSQQELRGAAMDIFGPNKGDREDVAAMILQRAVIRKLIGHNATFGKEKLIERLHLELKLMRGLRLLALCLCMFAVVIFAAVHEKQGHNRLGLLNTYKSLFQLDDSLAEIKTIDDLFDYLRLVSSRSRLIQVWFSQPRRQSRACHCAVRSRVIALFALTLADTAFASPSPPRLSILSSMRASSS